MLLRVLQLVVMPAFTFATGHLSPAELTHERHIRLVKVGIAFALNQGIWTLFQAYTLHQPMLPMSFWNTQGINWYLLCIMLWRLAMPTLKLFRSPFLWTMLLAVLCLFTDPYMFIRPVFTFQPYFVAGYQCPRAWLERLRTRWCAYLFPLCIAAVTFIGALAPHHWGLVEEVSTCYYKGIDAFAHFGQNCDVTNSPWYMTFMFILRYGVSLAFVAGFQACLPDRKLFIITAAGAFSLYIYLLHFYILKLLEYVFKTHGIVIPETWWGILCRIGIATTIWALLATGIERPIFQFCVEPPIDTCLLHEGDHAYEKELDEEGCLEQYLCVHHRERDSNPDSNTSDSEK